MSLLNLQKPTPQRSSYLLDIVDNTSNGSKRPTSSLPKMRKKPVPKIVAILGIIMMIISGFGVGILASEAMSPKGAGTEQANAWNIFDDLPSALLCREPKSQLGPYAGATAAFADQYDAVPKTRPNGGFMNVPVVEGQKTALEVYGYYDPNFTAWNGVKVKAQDNDDKMTFYGTGGGQGLAGNGGKDKVYGKALTINTASQSAIYSASAFDCINLPGNINAQIGNVILSLIKFPVAITGEVYGWATNATLTDADSPLKPVADAVNKMIVGEGSQKGLKDLLFLDFLTPMVLLAAIWFIFNGIIKRRSIETAQGAIWMIAAACGALLFLSNPLGLVSVVDDMVNKVNTAIVSSINETENNGAYCSLPAGAEDADTRVIKCTLWYSFIYVPWVSGQFDYDQYDLPDGAKRDIVEGGSITAGKSYVPGEWENDFDIIPSGDQITGASRGVLTSSNFASEDRIADTDSMLNWPYFQMNAMAGFTPSGAANVSEVALNQLVIQENVGWKNAANAIPAATTAVISGILPVLVVSGMSFTLLAYQVTMLLLIALAPIFLLLGVAPGWGRRIAMRWLELIVELLVKRILIVLFLAVFLRLLTTVLGAEMNWILQMILVAILSVIALTQRGRFMDIISDNIDFGGNKAIRDDGSSMAYMRGKTTDAYSKTSGFVKRGVSNLASRTPGKGNASQSVDGTKPSKAPIIANRKFKNDVTGRKAERIDAKVGLQSNDTTKGLGATKTRRKTEEHRTAQQTMLDNVNSHKDLDLTRLDAKERAKFLDSTGNVSPQRIDKWIAKTKNNVVSEQDELNRKLQENRKASKQAVRENRHSPAKRNAELQELRKNREDLRTRQANLNKHVKHVFGAGDQEETKKGVMPTAYRRKDKR